MSFENYVVSARYRLLGLLSVDPRYEVSLRAFEFALARHTGQRNGGEPEFIHQISIFFHAVQFHKYYERPWIIYSLIFLHDVVEDKNVPLSQIETEFGIEIRDGVDLLSKEVHGVKKVNYSLQEVFDNPETAVVKALDRSNNVSTMAFVFKPERLLRYVNETRDQMIPLIKAARRKFPSLEAVFENAKMVINQNLILIDALIVLRSKDGN